MLSIRCCICGSFRLWSAHDSTLGYLVEEEEADNGETACSLDGSNSVFTFSLADLPMAILTICDPFIRMLASMLPMTCMSIAKMGGCLGKRPEDGR